ENETGLALNFLQGNLFDKAASGIEGSQDITLHSGGNEISLNKANLSLTKTLQGETNLEVFGGSAEVRKDGKQILVKENQIGVLNQQSLDVKDRIKVLFPEPSETVYIVPKKQQQL